jgi:hypothetical protein
MQASVGIVSVDRCPHSGHVISFVVIIVDDDTPQPVIQRLAS